MRFSWQPVAIFFAGLIAASAFAGDVELKILLPQNRTAFQTNEWIDISVVRKSAQAIPAAPLTLTLSGAEDGSKISATFSAPAAATDDKGFASTEHYHINGWLVRPGKYDVEAAAHGAAATAQIDVFSHLRKSDFKLINWGRATKGQQLAEGEDSFGFNLIYGAYSLDEEANYIRAGTDFVRCCTMGGAHQMDIRMECDWSDPYVTKGGTSRAVREALMDRMRPNVPGVHFYDEPGLTWQKDPQSGEMTPHGIPSQLRSYEASCGTRAPDYKKVDLKDPESTKKWEFWAHWKLGFMNAAWKEAQFGVSYVRPDYFSATQSQYAGTAFADGYYFNVVRTLPIDSGHGGYHDWGPGYFNPSYTLELARARDFNKPDWYLPTWYGNTTADEFRLEQYLSFMTNLQGMISPPDIEPATNAGPRQGVVESNQTLLKLGTIFTQMPVTKPPVALLFSLSQAIHAQMQDMAENNYAHSIPHGRGLPVAYLAGKLIQQQFMFVLDEDVIDGTLLNDHKAVLLTSLDYLDPKVIAGLEEFAAKGGLVLLTADCTVAVKGGVKLSAAPRMPDQEKIDELYKAKKFQDAAPYQTVGKWMQGAQILGNAVKAELDKVGIKPVFECDTPAIAAARQASGDVEYLFAVNASWDEAEGKYLSMKSVTAQISIPNDGRPVYDAMVGGKVLEFEKKGEKLTGAFRFGPGQMRVFARTARPIGVPPNGGATISTPVVQRTMTYPGGDGPEQAPIKVTCNITVLDETGAPVCGAIPLHIFVMDGLQSHRYEFYRATRNGTLALEFPLAANDPPGKWSVRAEDLLHGILGKGTLSVTEFDYQPPAKIAAIAGATPRAVFAPGDRDNVFRFARVHHTATIVKGTSKFNNAAAERIIRDLKPWGVTCSVMDLTEASKPRALSEDEARTWCGTEPGRMKAGSENSPKQAGFAVQGPVILLGNPEDNAILRLMKEMKFLPYMPAAGSFPGNGRGMVAWARDGVGRAQESIALIAYDEAGMNEVAGSLYEAVAGIEPLTKFVLPESHEIAPATKAHDRQIVNRNWGIRLPDRIEALKIDGDKIIAYTHDGSECTVDKRAKGYTSKVIPAAEYAAAVKAANPEPAAELKAAMKANERPDRLMKFGLAMQVKEDEKTVHDYYAFAYWGGDLRVVGKAGTLFFAPHFPNDITAMAFFEGTLILGLADGRLMTIFGNLIVPRPIK